MTTPTMFDQPPPPDPNVHEQDRDRLSAQNAMVLEALKRGPVKESDFYPQIKRLGARIYDLRHAGYQIKTITTRPVAVYALANTQEHADVR